MRQLLLPACDRLVAPPQHNHNLEQTAKAPPFGGAASFLQPRHAPDEGGAFPTAYLREPAALVADAPRLVAPAASSATTRAPAPGPSSSAAAEHDLDAPPASMPPPAALTRPPLQPQPPLPPSASAVAPPAVPAPAAAGAPSFFSAFPSAVATPPPRATATGPTVSLLRPHTPSTLPSTGTGSVAGSESISSFAALTASAAAKQRPPPASAAGAGARATDAAPPALGPRGGSSSGAGPAGRSSSPPRSTVPKVLPPLGQHSASRASARAASLPPAAQSTVEAAAAEGPPPTGPYVTPAPLSAVALSGFIHRQQVGGGGEERRLGLCRVPRHRLLLLPPHRTPCATGSTRSRPSAQP